MQGTIDVAAIMAIQRYKTPPSPPAELLAVVRARMETVRADAQSFHEHITADRTEWLEKQRLRSMQRVYAEYFTALYADDQATMAVIRRENGDLLEEALERKRAHDQWLKKVHAPRVTAWKRRIAERQARRVEEDRRRELGTVRWIAGRVGRFVTQPIT